MNFEITLMREQIGVSAISSYLASREARWPHGYCARLVSLVSSSGPGSSPSRGHFVVFLGKTLYSHSVSLHPGIVMGTGELNATG